MTEWTASLGNGNIKTHKISLKHDAYSVQQHGWEQTPIEITPVCETVC